MGSLKRCVLVSVERARALRRSNAGVVQTHVLTGGAMGALPRLGTLVAESKRRALRARGSHRCAAVGSVPLSCRQTDPGHRRRSRRSLASGCRTRLRPGIHISEYSQLQPFRLSGRKAGARASRTCIRVSGGAGLDGAQGDGPAPAGRKPEPKGLPLEPTEVSGAAQALLGRSPTFPREEQTTLEYHARACHSRSATIHPARAPPVRPEGYLAAGGRGLGGKRARSACGSAVFVPGREPPCGGRGTGGALQRGCVEALLSQVGCPALRRPAAPNGRGQKGEARGGSQNG